MSQEINQSDASHEREIPPRTEILLGRVLGEVSSKLSRGQEFRDILDFLFDSLGLIIPYDRIGIALIDETNPDQLCSIWQKSILPMTYLGVGYTAPIKGSSLEEILETGQPRIINDLIEHDREHPNSYSTELMLKEGIRSSLTCPLRSNGEPMGIVFFSSSHPNTYKDEHIEIYSTIADELSVLVEQARLKKWFHSELRLKNVRMLLHDLKNPLNVIQAFLDISQRKPWFQELGEDAKKVFSTLKRNSDFMQELLEELSDLHKLGDKENGMDMREISLVTFIPDVATRAREFSNQKENTITIETGANLPETARFDMTHIHRVIGNLISNASKFSRRGSNIHLAIKRDDNRLVFEVKDEGPGIPKEEQTKLFCEFGRTSVQATEGEKSTGLGLAIAKEIVEKHGGKISCKSEVGVGSTFSFWLPLDPPIH